MELKLECAICDDGVLRICSTVYNKEFGICYSIEDIQLSFLLSSLEAQPAID